MEDKARKYCRLHKVKPAFAIACIYKELSQNLINGIGVLLLEWCLYTAEFDEAFLDLMIPIDCHQLNDFITELLSSESSDALIIARAVKTLKNEKATVTTLNNLSQMLRRCRQTVDALVFLSVINARIGRDKECLRHLHKLSEANEITPLRSRLHLLSIADLQLLKLTIESSELVNAIGIRNNAYSRDNSFESIDSEIDQSLESDLAIPATRNLQPTCKLINSEETAMGRVYGEIIAALSHLMELDLYLGAVIQSHLDAERPYIAGWVALRWFNENGQLPNLDANIAKALHTFILKVLNDLFETCEKEGESHSHTSELLERALKYCRLASSLDKHDLKTKLMFLKCLYQNTQVSDALAMGEELLDLGHKSNEILQVISYCRIFDGDYCEALNVMNSAIDTTRDCVESICVRGFALFLAGKVKGGTNDILSACKSDISTTATSFKKLKPTDRDTIRDCITDNIKESIAPGKTGTNRLDRKDNSQNSCQITKECMGSKTNEEFHDLKILCNLLTKLYKKHLQIHLLQVEVLLKLQKYGDAQKCLVLFIKKIPDDPLPMIHLANVRMRLGAYVAAVEDFRVIIRAIGCQKFADKLTQLSGDDRDDIARVLRQHGFQHLQRRSYGEAIECFNIAIIALGDVAAGLILVRAFSFANLGDYELALNDFNAVLDRESDNVAARVGSSVMYAVLGYEEESLDNMTWILSDYRDTTIKVLQKLPFECVRQFTAAIENVVCEQLEQEITNATYIKETDILSQTQACVEFLQLLYHKSTKFVALHAQYLTMSGKHQAALEAINAGLKTSPNDSVLTSKKGLVLAKQSKTIDALDILRSISDEYKTIVEYDLKQLTSAERNDLTEEAACRADHLCSIGDYEGADEYYSLAIFIVENKNVDILRRHVTCLLNAGLIQQALGHISSIIEMKPTYQDYCQRAKLLDSIGKEKAACLDYIMALEQNEQNTVAYLMEEAILKHVLCMFCTASSSAFVREQHQEVLKYCDYGLKLDPNHKGMKQLRYRTKCVMNKCNIQ